MAPTHHSPTRQGGSVLSRVLELEQKEKQDRIAAENASPKAKRKSFGHSPKHALTVMTQEEPSDYGVMDRIQLFEQAGGDSMRSFSSSKVKINSSEKQLKSTQNTPNTWTKNNSPQKSNRYSFDGKNYVVTHTSTPNDKDKDNWRAFEFPSTFHLMQEDRQGFDSESKTHDYRQSSNTSVSAASQHSEVVVEEVDWPADDISAFAWKEGSDIIVTGSDGILGFSSGSTDEGIYFAPERSDSNSLSHTAISQPLPGVSMNNSAPRTPAQGQIFGTEFQVTPTQVPQSQDSIQALVVSANQTGNQFASFDEFNQSGTNLIGIDERKEKRLVAYSGASERPNSLQIHPDHDFAPTKTDLKPIALGAPQLENKPKIIEAIHSTVKTNLSQIDDPGDSIDFPQSPKRDVNWNENPSLFSRKVYENARTRFSKYSETTDFPPSPKRDINWNENPSPFRRKDDEDAQTTLTATTNKSESTYKSTQSYLGSPVYGSRSSRITTPRIRPTGFDADLQAEEVEENNLTSPSRIARMSRAHRLRTSKEESNSPRTLIHNTQSLKKSSIEYLASSTITNKNDGSDVRNKHMISTDVLTNSDKVLQQGMDELDNIVRSKNSPDGSYNYRKGSRERTFEQIEPLTSDEEQDKISPRLSSKNSDETPDLPHLQPEPGRLTQGVRPVSPDLRLLRIAANSPKRQEQFESPLLTKRSHIPPKTENRSDDYSNSRSPRSDPMPTSALGFFTEDASLGAYKHSTSQNSPPADLPHSPNDKPLADQLEHKNSQKATLRAHSSGKAKNRRNKDDLDESYSVATDSTPVTRHGRLAAKPKSEEINEHLNDVKQRIVFMPPELNENSNIANKITKEIWQPQVVDEELFSSEAPVVEKSRTEIESPEIQLPVSFSSSPPENVIKSKPRSRKPHRNESSSDVSTLESKLIRKKGMKPAAIPKESFSQSPSSYDDILRELNETAESVGIGNDFHSPSNKSTGTSTGKSITSTESANDSPKTTGKSRHVKNSTQEHPNDQLEHSFGEHGDDLAMWWQNTYAAIQNPDVNQVVDESISSPSTKCPIESESQILSIKTEDLPFKRFEAFFDDPDHVNKMEEDAPNSPLTSDFTSRLDDEEETIFNGVEDHVSPSKQNMDGMSFNYSRSTSQRSILSKQHVEGSNQSQNNSQKTLISKDVKNQQDPDVSISPKKTLRSPRPKKKDRRDKRRSRRSETSSSSILSDETLESDAGSSFALDLSFAEVTMDCDSSPYSHGAQDKTNEDECSSSRYSQSKINLGADTSSPSSQGGESKRTLGGDTNNEESSLFTRNEASLATGGTGGSSRHQPSVITVVTSDTSRQHASIGTDGTSVASSRKHYSVDETQTVSDAESSKRSTPTLDTLWIFDDKTSASAPNTQSTKKTPKGPISAMLQNLSCCFLEPFVDNLCQDKKPTGRTNPNSPPSGTDSGTVSSKASTYEEDESTLASKALSERVSNLTRFGNLYWILFNVE